MDWYLVNSIINESVSDISNLALLPKYGFIISYQNLYISNLDNSSIAQPT